MDWIVGIRRAIDYIEDNLTETIDYDEVAKMSRKYEVERAELKVRISKLRDDIVLLKNKEQDKETFVSAIRKFMRMEAITAPLLHELIDHIDVYETEGTGKNKTQRIVIYYRFVGCIELPIQEEELFSNDTRQGVAVTYIPKALPESITA